MGELDRMLERCRALEERAGAVYRGFAAAARSQPELCALWTALAREEDEHARTLARALLRLPATERWRTRLDGWEEALADVEERLAAAAGLGSGASPDLHLAAALDLELSELEVLRQELLAVTNHTASLPRTEDHAERLAHAATHLSTDPHVGLQAALLLARSRLRSTPDAPRPLH
jgi:rubrerythrin